MKTISALPGDRAQQILHSAQLLSGKPLPCTVCPPHGVTEFTNCTIHYNGTALRLINHDLNITDNTRQPLQWIPEGSTIQIQDIPVFEVCRTSTTLKKGAPAFPIPPFTPRRSIQKSHYALLIVSSIAAAILFLLLATN